VKKQNAQNLFKTLLKQKLWIIAKLHMLIMFKTMKTVLNLRTFAFTAVFLNSDLRADKTEKNVSINVLKMEMMVQQPLLFSGSPLLLVQDLKTLMMIIE